MICGFINPYGIESIKYLFNSYGFSKINNLVGEMRAVTMAENNGKIIFMVIFLMLYSFYRNKGYNKIRFFLLFIGLSYLALCHYKGIIFLGIIMPLILGYNFQKNKKDCDIKLRLMDKEIYLSCIVGCLIYIIFFIPLKDGVEIKEFADYLDENTSHDIKLFTGYNDGAYMEYRGYKCYIDPRAEVFLKNNNHVEDIINEYYDLETSKLDPREFLQKYNFDYLLVDENSRLLLYELRNNQHYEKIMSKKNIKLDSMTYLYKNNGGEKNEKSN